MTAYYNEKKGTDSYSTINVTNWDEVNINCTFEELFYLKDDTFYYLFFHPTKVSGVSKYGSEKGWTVPEELTMVKIAHSEYSKKDWKTKETVTIKPYEVEKLFVSILNEYEQKVVYTGEFWLNNSNQVEKINSGAYDKDIENSLKETYISLSEVKSPQHIKPQEVDIPKSYSGSYGGRGSSQSEKDKINDRWNFIKEQIKIALPDVEVESIHDLVKLFDNDTTSSVIAQVYDFCKDLIH